MQGCLGFRVQGMKRIWDTTALPRSADHTAHDSAWQAQQGSQALGLGFRVQMNRGPNKLGFRVFR